MTHLARLCGCVVVPQTKQLQFTYLPNGSEIVSIDAFNKSSETNDFVIGVTIVKGSETGSCGQYINIYSDWQPDAQNIDDCESEHSCLSLELEFIPYQLSHVIVGSQFYWILGGSDNKIHVFSEAESIQSYEELEEDDTLAEFAAPLPCVPLFTDIFTKDGIRTTGTVCENGYLVVSKVDVQRNELLKTWNTTFDAPLTSIAFIRHQTHQLKKPEFLSKVLPDEISSSSVTKEQTKLSLAVGYSLKESMVFTDIDTHGLTKIQWLESSFDYDCVTCLWVADITFQGKPTILLGTYGQELLGYTQDSAGTWQLSWHKPVSAPILGIRYADLTGDGVKEVIVITSTGVQVFQHQLEDVKEIALARLKQLINAKNFQIQD